MSMSVEETHSEFDRLIPGYISGDLSPAEKRKFEESLHKDAELKARLDESRKIWDVMDAKVSEQSYDLDAEWKLMKAQIPDLEREVPVREHRAKSHPLLFYSYRIAAALVVGLLIAFGWNFGRQLVGTEKLVAHAEPLEHLLDDGTHITLNRNSKLRYKKSFPSSGRKVSLSGEAWFDVARDSARPFVIDAGSALVEVLGTSFNVNAYEKNNTIEITVESGLVALGSKAETQDKQEQLILRAGNSGSYHKKSQELLLIPRADPNNISWKTRELYFDATPLNEAIELINKVYGSHLVIENEALAGCSITVSFRNQNLEAILNVLEATLDLELTRRGNVIKLDGAACQ